MYRKNLDLKKQQEEMAFYRPAEVSIILYVSMLSIICIFVASLTTYSGYDLFVGQVVCLFVSLIYILQNYLLSKGYGRKWCQVIFSIIMICIAAPIFASANGLFHKGVAGLALLLSCLLLYFSCGKFLNQWLLYCKTRRYFYRKKLTKVLSNLYQVESVREIVKIRPRAVTFMAGLFFCLFLAIIIWFFSIKFVLGDFYLKNEQVMMVIFFGYSCVLTVYACFLVNGTLCSADVIILLVASLIIGLVNISNIYCLVFFFAAVILVVIYLMLRLNMRFIAWYSMYSFLKKRGRQP